MGVECEKLCKKMGIYPNCQCPGFEGSPATSFDYRACFVKYCQDRSALEFSCPTDAFVTCVKQATQVSVLQWPALLQCSTRPKLWRTRPPPSSRRVRSESRAPVPML